VPHGGARRARTAGLVVAAAFAGGIAGALGGLLLGGGSHPRSAALEAAAAEPTPASDPDAPLSAEAIYRRSAPGVVAILGASAGTASVPAALGSGFVLDGEGYIATGYRVIAGAGSLRVGFGDGTSYPATVVGGDLAAGVAVVRVEAPEGRLHPLAFEPSTRLAVGDPVYALGVRPGVGGTMSAGIVSAVRVSAASGGRARARAFVADVGVGAMNAGGPFLDRYGRVVGIGVAAGEAATAETVRPALRRLVARARGSGVA
jgi:putative serine protease PepD